MRSSKERERDSGKKQLKIFVDANTIISGLVFEGNEALLLRLGEVGACTLVTTQDVINEVYRVLRAREFRLGQEEATWLVSFTNRCVNVHESVKPKELSQYFERLRDKKDLYVLAAFEKLNCDILVTGDKELLEKVNGAKTTREALNILLGKL